MTKDKKLFCNFVPGEFRWDVPCSKYKNDGPMISVRRSVCSEFLAELNFIELHSHEPDARRRRRRRRRR